MVELSTSMSNLKLICCGALHRLKIGCGAYMFRDPHSRLQLDLTEGLKTFVWKRECLHTLNTHLHLSIIASVPVRKSPVWVDTNLRHRQETLTGLLRTKLLPLFWFYWLDHIDRENHSCSTGWTIFTLWQRNSAWRHTVLQPHLYL